MNEDKSFTPPRYGWRQHPSHAVAIAGFPLQNQIGELIDNDEESINALTIQGTSNEYLNLLTSLAAEKVRSMDRLKYSEENTAEVQLSLKYVEDIVKLARNAGADEIQLVTKTDCPTYIQFKTTKNEQENLVGEALIAPRISNNMGRILSQREAEE